jgi:GNAT superfamily N-acetyltransferase
MIETEGYHPPMIRPTTPDDTIAVLTIASAIGFQSEELEQLNAMLTDSFSGDSDNFWLTDDDNGPVGVAYCEPERMTQQTWNLQLIAIHPDRQGQGRGATLMDYVEQTLTTRGGRILLVETSGLPDFAGTRMFYTKCGYEEEARIRDFYAAGEDKVVFRKVLKAEAN